MTAAGPKPEPAPAPMEGGGAYNRNARVQASGLQPAIDWLAAAAAAVPLDDAPIAIADYGASQGANSFAPVAAALAALRPRIGPTRPVSVLHTDLPGNDCAALFRALADDPASYARADPAVFPAAVGRSFYGPVLPPDSVTLGWSSWAVQWLSRAPCAIPDQVQVAFSRDAAARAAFAARAAADWRAFLAARATELRPGGRLVVLTMALDASGDFGYGPLLAALYKGLEAEAASGALPEAAFRRMAIPTVGRSATELAAPFAELPGLRLEGLEVFAAEDRIWADYRADRDAAAWAARWAGFCRASVFPTLAAAIEGPDAPARRAAFMDRLEAGLARRLAARPEPMNIPLARLAAARV